MFQVSMYHTYTFYMLTYILYQYSVLDVLVNKLAIDMPRIYG